MCWYSKLFLFLLFVLVAFWAYKRWFVGNYTGDSLSNSSAVLQKSPLKVVNVLSKELYDDAHITGSVHIDFSRVKEEAQAWDKKDPVVFYCANYQCQSSAEAARQLAEMGFENVMAYEGGMEEWFRLNRQGDASYKFEGPALQEYLSIKVEAPTSHEDGMVMKNVKIVSADDLKQLMQQAGI